MLRIPQAIYDTIIDHAREGFPLEVCGILGGLEGEVSIQFPMTNVDASSEHFTLDPKEQFRVIKELRSRKLEMVAVYHSHPASPARPSAEDIRLALTPDISHVIVSLVEPDTPVLKSFRITGGVVEPEEISLI